MCGFKKIIIMWILLKGCIHNEHCNTCAWHSGVGGAMAIYGAACAVVGEITTT